MNTDNPAAVQNVVIQRDELQNGLLSTCREVSRATTVRITFLHHQRPPFWHLRSQSVVYPGIHSHVCFPMPKILTPVFHCLAIDFSCLLHFVQIFKHMRITEISEKRLQCRTDRLKTETSACFTFITNLENKGLIVLVKLVELYKLVFDPGDFVNPEWLTGLQHKCNLIYGPKMRKTTLDHGSLLFHYCRHFVKIVLSCTLRFSSLLGNK